VSLSSLLASRPESQAVENGKQGIVCLEGRRVIGYSLAHLGEENFPPFISAMRHWDDNHRHSWKNTVF
jgi:hypothetical protein